AFSYNHSFTSPVNTKFDVNHLEFRQINLSAENIEVINDTLTLTVNALTALEKNSGITINSLTTVFQVSQQQMKFMDLNLSFNDSQLFDEVSLNYSSLDNLSYFQDSVTLSANLVDSRLASADLDLFVPGLKNMPEKFILSGKLEGRFGNFRFSDFMISIGRQTSFSGQAHVSGLPDTENTFLNIEVTRSAIFVPDLSGYLHEDLKNTLRNTKSMSFNGQLLGYPSDFVAFGNFNTEFGRIDSDVNFKIKNNSSRAEYSGRVNMKNFQLGNFLGDKKFQRLSFQGSIMGSGLDIEHANIDVNGRIEQLGINQYNYTGIYADARLSHQLFEGMLTIDDPNIKFQMTGTVDLRPAYQAINITSNLDTLNLLNLGFSTTNTRLKMSADFQFKGLSLDSISGIARVNDLLLIEEDDSVYIDSIVVSSVKDVTRKINITSSLADLSVEGTFGYYETLDEIKHLQKEYATIIKNDSASLARLSAERKTRKPAELEIACSLLLKNPDPMLRFYNIDAHIAENTLIEGYFSNGKTTIINLSASPDTLRIEDNVFIHNTLEINTSKIYDSTNVLAMVYLQSESQNFSRTSTEDLLVEGIWNNTHLDYELSVSQSKYRNKLNFIGGLDFFKGLTEITIDSSNIRLLNEPWSVRKDNYIHINRDQISLHHLNVFHQDQSMGVEGVISNNPEDILNLYFNNLNIETINSFINKELTGTLNGTVDLSDLYQNTKIENDLSIDQFAINAFPVGDVHGRIKWDKQNEQFILSLSISDNKTTTMVLEGKYLPEKELPLFINAELMNTNINILEPFIGSYFSDIQGNATGKFQITGT
ncbi:MAG: hypothetical protein OEY51_11610, partial [Cyclobacteriaceae bacterium]|nr:hypothetical protein [Cyclobacteriaceae bacterium]